MKFLKVILWILIIVIVIAGGFLLYVNIGLPDAGDVPEISIEQTHERLERGEYLATHVMVCISCHSPRDWDQYAGPVIKSKMGGGGDFFGHKKGLPGKFYPRNLTPFHVGDWTDGELLHAIAAGINKKGDPLFPIMPYHDYGTLDKEDLYAVIAFLRTLPPVESEIKDSKADFPLGIIMNFMPEEPNFSERPDESNKIAYGEYLVKAAACYHCHTPQEKGQFIDSLKFSGGMEFPMETGGISVAANITPDRETGIGTWSEEAFVQKFKFYLDSDYTGEKVEEGEMNTEMPWREYAGMKEKDLRAIYAYLRTIEPVKHQVVKFVSE